MEGKYYLRKFYIICFDISNDKNRRKVVKLLKNSGTRVQKSVFECLLDDKQFIDLKDNLEKIIDWNTDSLRYYQLCEHCIQNIKIAGIGFYTEDDNLIIS